MYWLRPENAVISAILANQLAKLSCDGVALDMSCGDGLFMHTMLGGEISFDFDIFKSTDNLEKVRSKNADIYDFVDAQYCPNVIARPKRKIEYALDIKTSMLQKAKALNFYNALIQCDVCRGVGLENNTIDTIYINHTVNAYENLDKALAEIRRIMSDGGRAYISVYDISIINFLSDVYTNYPTDLAKVIDRGLLATFFRQRYQYTDWIKVFENAGFCIERVYPLVSKEFIPYWCIGMRPIAPLLINLVNTLRIRDNENLVKIKREWLDLFSTLASPFLCSKQSPEESSCYLLELSK
jgi:ubiquinone/menaquinone biosynthesis C-methylase UbiE